VKFSENWLRSLVDIEKVNSSQLISRLTMAGLEVEDVVKAGGNFTKVIIAQITQAVKHPTADKLQICKVNTGNEELQIVCGAPNARVGIKVPLALVGAVLPNNLVISAAKLRDVDSFGMLCSAAELGISDDHSGLLELPLDAVNGTDLRTYLDLDDNCIELSLTPDRGDCLSLLGIARETKAIFNTDIKFRTDFKIAATDSSSLPIKIKEPKSCPIYCGRIIKDINLQQETPIDIKEKLRRSGIRSINLAVDITNYVMLELGQPLHAFDLAQIKDEVIVRNAKDNEKITLLDGKSINLNADTLVIADTEKVLALAGIMGGQYSGVNDKTKDLFLESAFFTPLTVASKARSFGLHTDASHRYERGVDPSLAPIAIERATELLLKFGGGVAGEVITVSHLEFIPVSKIIDFKIANITKMLGISIPSQQIKQIFINLGLMINEVNDEVWQVTVPNARFDLELEIDLIAEIARIYGYDNIAAQYPAARIAPAADTESVLDIKQIRSLMNNLEYQEVITYSFISNELAEIFAPDDKVIAVANPISQEMAVMRPNLWPGLFKTAKYNLKRQHERVRLFETGLKFNGDLDNLSQINVIAGIAVGTKYSENWNHPQNKLDFYDVKADVEALLNLGNNLDKCQFVAANHPALHPGQSAVIIKNDKRIGWLGLIHPKIAKRLDIQQPLFLFELLLEDVQQGQLPQFTFLSKFPLIRRDLAFVVPADVVYADLALAVKESAGEHLVDICLFDLYSGDNIASDHKSIAIGLTFQHPNKTLTDDEINSNINNIINACITKFNASLRK